MWKYILALLRLCVETVVFGAVWAFFQLFVSTGIVDPNTLWWLNTYGLGIIVLFVLWRSVNDIVTIGQFVQQQVDLVRRMLKVVIHRRPPGLRI